MRSTAVIGLLASTLATATRAGEHDEFDATCAPQWDNPANETEGNNFMIVPNITQDACAQQCCNIPQCVAVSWNFPMPASSSPCVANYSCCYLKDTIQGIEPNHNGPWVHTGRFAKPAAPIPKPSALQERFMKGDWAADGSTVGSFTQFMHFSVTTFGNIEHDCVDGKCLPASMFNPTNVDTDQWVQTAKAMGASEICLTAHHEGGFMLAPTTQQTYSVASSPWGKDILAPFVQSCKKYNISICYYIGPNANGYLTQVEKATPEVFIEKQLNMTLEVLTKYGPVRRLWWDHFDGSCGGLSECPGGFPEAWPRFVDLVRSTSPYTIIGTGPDVGHSAGGESGDGSYPRWNACNTSDGTNFTHCTNFGPRGYQFKPREADATIQNPGDAWFWHPDHAYWNASDIWDHFFLTWGRGDAFILNMPPNTTGIIAEEYADAGAAFGDALRSSFGKALAHTVMASPSSCDMAVLELTVPEGGANAFMTRETMTDNGQRISNYTIETSSDGTSWTALPPVDAVTNLGVHGQTVGYRVVDILPEGMIVAAGDRARVRCTGTILDPVHFRDFGMYMAVRP